MAKVTVEEKDGTVRELETVPSYEVSPEDAHEGSGLYSALQDFVGDEDDTKKKDDKGKIIDEKLDDDTKGKKADDIKNLLDDNTDGKKAGDDDTKKAGDEDDKSTDDGSKSESVGKDNYTELNEEALRLKATELDASVITKDSEIEKLTTNLKTAQSQLDTLQKDGVGDPEVTEFFKGLRTDFAGTVDKYREKYGIPDNNTLLTQMGGGATAAKNARLKQFVEKELKPRIEKQFGLEDGKFAFDKDTAWDDPESASYAFRKGLESKEEEFENVDLSLKATEKETLTKIQVQQAADRKWYAEKYLGGDETKVEEIMQTLNAIPAKIAKGELKPEDHPLSLRYVLRGYNYDTLVKGEVGTAITNLKQQLKDMGVVFPDNMKDLPTDITNLKKVEKESKAKPFEIEQSKYSPMAESIENTLNN